MMQISEAQSQAHRAAIKFRKMIPTLTSYARNISGNKSLRIEITAEGARTDGKIIYLSPPLGLGDTAPHVKELCDVRNPSDLLMECLACRAHEEVMVNLYHEIAHNAFGSFVEVDSQALVACAEDALRGTESNFAKSALKKIKRTGGYLGYASASHLISPHLSVVANVLDDVRINQRMFEARPGMKKMFIADEMRLALEGIPITDPTTGQLKAMHYVEMPLDAQVCLGVYFSGAGYSIESIFTDEVIEALQDEELSRLISKASDSPNMGSVFSLSIQTLLRLRELGFLQAPNDPKEEEHEASPSASGDGDNPSEGTDSQPQDGAPSDDHPGDAPPDDDPSPAPESPIPGSESDDETKESGDSGDNKQENSDDDGHAPRDESTPEDGSDNDQTGGDGEGNSNQTDDEVSEGSGGDGIQPEAGENSSESSESGDDLSEPSESESNEKSEPEYSDPQEVMKLVQIALGHQDDDSKEDLPFDEQKKLNSAMKIAVNQAHHFDTMATNISGVLLHEDMAVTQGAWGYSHFESDLQSLKPSESILGPALLKTRVTFSANKRAHYQNDIKAGKVNPRVLGKRAHLNDDRLFRRKQLPGKRDYFVLIGVDISGSTISRGLRDLIIKSAFAQAELLHRVGVNFAIYAHSGGAPGYGSSLPEDSYALEIFQIKSPDQQWNSAAKERLANLNPYSANIDGHTLEFYRKILDSRSETDRIIMYYTDGAMPYYNFDEELEVLQREIKTCRQRNYTLMAVGVGTDSPVAHGLDTVQIDTEEDISKVVKHLDKRLIRKS